MKPKKKQSRLSSPGIDSTAKVRKRKSGAGQTSASSSASRKRTRSRSAVQETCPSLDPELDVLADSTFSVDCPAQFIDSCVDLVHRNMKRYPAYLSYDRKQNGDNSNLQAWPKHLERTFIRAALLCRSQKYRARLYNSTSVGYLDAVARYMSVYANTYRKVKQISSHVQVLRGHLGSTGPLAAILFNSSATPKANLAIELDGTRTLSSYVPKSSPAMPITDPFHLVQDTLLSAYHAGAVPTGGDSTPFDLHDYVSIAPDPPSLLVTKSDGSTSLLLNPIQTSCQPQLIPREFSMHLLQPGRPPRLLHTFTTLPSNGKRADMSEAEFVNTRGALFPSLVGSDRSIGAAGPVVLLNIQVDMNTSSFKVEPWHKFNLRTEFETTSDAQIDNLVCDTTILEQGVVMQYNKDERLHLETARRRVIGFSFGASYWSDRLKSLESHDCADASGQLAQYSAIQEIWTLEDSIRRCLLVVCWEFEVGSRAETTWRTVAKSAPARPSRSSPSPVGSMSECLPTEHLSASPGPISADIPYRSIEPNPTAYDFGRYSRATPSTSSSTLEPWSAVDSSQQTAYLPILSLPHFSPFFFPVIPVFTTDTDAANPQYTDPSSSAFDFGSRSFVETLGDGYFHTSTPPPGTVTPSSISRQPTVTAEIANWQPDSAEPGHSLIYPTRWAPDNFVATVESTGSGSVTADGRSQTPHGSYGYVLSQTQAPTWGESLTGDNSGQGRR